MCLSHKEKRITYQTLQREPDTKAKISEAMTGEKHLGSAQKSI